LLDEAHRVSFDENSPVERILREGRKFGVGAILASQQPEDFSSVAYSNTASKIIFNLLDRTGGIARQIALRTSNRDTIIDLIKSLGTLPRGTAIFIGNQEATIVKIATMKERRYKWREGDKPSAH
jgi:DNA helicase HerA-like ATPase